MNQLSLLKTREVSAYLILSSIVICGLLASIVTAPKLMHVGFTFPFANIVFSIFSYPFVDCICELWGKSAARMTIWVGLAAQALFAGIIHLSILAPYASFWQLQSEYAAILASSGKVVLASLAAFSVSQILDVTIYQRLKQMTKGKSLWLRSNLSIYCGQAVDSLIFVSVVFGQSSQKYSILLGSITIKILVAFLMTPIMYAIVFSVNRYLDGKTLAFNA